MLLMTVLSRSAHRPLTVVLLSLLTLLPSINAQEAATYADGSFSYPNVWPSYFPVGTTMNITWTSNYTRTNLFVIQNENFTNSVPISTNIVQPYYVWTVTTASTNLTGAFVFRIVNAEGTEEEQTGGGFLSDGFYITDDSASKTSSSTTSTGSATASKTQSSATTTESLAAPTASSSGTTSGSAAPSATNSAAASSPVSSSSLSSSAKYGLGIGLGLGIPLVAIVAFIFYRLGRRGHRYKPQPSGPNSDTEMSTAAGTSAAASLHQQQTPYDPGARFAEAPGNEYDGHGRRGAYELAGNGAAELDGGEAQAGGRKYYRDT